MSATALFGNTSGLGGSSGGNKHLVEFRAGRMTLKGRMVHPDKRKGLLYVYQGEDSLMHFCWKDRTTGEVEDDLLIFPDDCEFVRVNECTTGRVYVLKFKSLSKKYFFWMQEPKSDKDDDYCRRINEALNNPPTSGGRGGGGSGGQDGELQNLLNNMSQQQLMQLFGGVGQIGGLSSLLGTMGNNSSNSGSRPSAGSGTRGGGAARAPSRARDAATPAPAAAPAAAAAATPAPATAPAAAATAATPASATAPVAADTDSPAQPRSGQIFLSDLQRYFSGLGNAPPEGDDSSAGATAGTESSSADRAGAVTLSSMLASPEVISVATTPENVAQLTPLLPPAPTGVAQDDVRTTLLSPQFAQAANLFSSALSTGEMGPVMTQFGLPAEVAAAASTGDMGVFFKALENTSGESDSSKSKEGDDKKKEDKPKGSNNDKKDDDAEMSLD
ncbi:hypothetical protein O3G_MSEX007986 [Manduca sexta]|uniref:Proteasomal ubiquitin receptor ADRM1 homolog n=1 Tax=Manduca sexta TaxID=7130 RepID=A0A922CN38_MANSE|nr:hypothetical protein O3G_MSEX007986 [Manduca sexta]